MTFLLTLLCLGFIALCSPLPLWRRSTVYGKKSILDCTGEEVSLLRKERERDSLRFCVVMLAIPLLLAWFGVWLKALPAASLTLLVFGTLVVPNGGEVIMLDAATGKTAATTWTLRLYCVISPALGSGSVVANFTEAAGGGYAAKALTAANWVTTPGTPTSSAYPLQTFTFTGALTTNPNILGYYVTRADGSLVYAEPLAASFTPANNGDTLDVTPIVTLGSVASD